MRRGRTLLLLALLGLSGALACSRAAGSAPAATTRIEADRELLITDPSVVADPARTADGGAWSFGALMASLAGREDRSAFTLRWLHLLEQDYVVEGARVGGRPLSRRPVLARWLERSGCSANADCQLDFGSAPFRLEAIVNRMDLRAVDAKGAVTDAGEGRFVFAVEAPAQSGAPDPSETKLSLILEYNLLATTPDQVKQWAARWHALSALQGEAYRAALQRITDDFARRDARRTFHHLRTSELGNHPWELRELHLEAGGLVLESGKHNGCAGCHLDRAEFEHVHSEGAGAAASLSRFLVEAEIPRRERDFGALLAVRGAAAH